MASVRAFFFFLERLMAPGDQLYEEIKGLTLQTERLRSDSLNDEQRNEVKRALTSLAARTIVVRSAVARGPMQDARSLSGVMG